MKKSIIATLLMTSISLAASSLSADITFSDDFNRNNTTAGDLGPNWTVYNDGFFINSNVAKTQTSGINIATLNGYDINDSFSIEVDVYSQSNNRYAGIVFNFYDTDNYYVFRSNFTSSGTSAWQFLKIENGVTSVVDDGTLAANDEGMRINSWYNLSVSSTETPGTYSYRATDLSGDVVYASGTITDTSLELGGASGFYFSNSYGWVDNYSMSTVPEPSASALVLVLLSMGIVIGRRRFKKRAA